jgi:hypothetical protein
MFTNFLFSQKVPNPAFCLFFIAIVFYRSAFFFGCYDVAQRLVLTAGGVSLLLFFLNLFFIEYLIPFCFNIGFFCVLLWKIFYCGFHYGIMFFLY